jgi:2-dehydro-3-deoxyphosphogluconate aldolase/(4S)-4-hydroxy-2-oxoglutarate aldolase
MAVESRTVTAAIEAIRSRRVVAILRRVDDPLGLVRALREGGVSVVEITLDSARALATIAELRRDPELVVLAGTVRTADEARAAVEAGAQACVGPALVPAVLEACRELGVPAIPGALTPTEVETAWRLGAAMVKLFPAARLGPAYVRDLRGPLPEVPLLATGGVDATNAAAFLRAGAEAVGVGSALVAVPDVAAAARELVGSTRDA